MLQAQARLRAVQRRRPPRRSPRPCESRPTKVRRGHGMHKPSRPRAYVRRRRSQRGRRARRGPFSGSRTRRRRFRARRHRPRARGRRSAARARRRRLDAQRGRWRRPRKYKRRVRVGKPLHGELRAGGDAAGRRRRGASDGHTASTASCGHCGHAGRASSATFGVRGVLFLCKECRPARINQQFNGAHRLISTQVRAPPTSAISPRWTRDRQCRK